MADAHFNLLTPDQDERLALLVEELGEAIAAIGKIQRHGYDGFNPDDDTHPGNREQLEKELGDVQFAVDQLVNAGDLRRVRITGHATKKFVSVGQWLHHHEVL